MIVYQATKQSFLGDTDNRDIEDVIAAAYLARTGRYAPHAEMRAWRESLTQMAKVLKDEEIPADIGVGIEFGIPQTNKRIDFILSGRASNDRPHAVIVELKQWSNSKLSDKDGIIVAQRGGASEREGPHPSYQAWSYAAMLEGFNEAVYDENVFLQPCAYLHNYVEDGVINHESYDSYLEKAPLFLKGDAERQKLRNFIKEHVKYGDNGELLFKIDKGRIRPSKMLADSLVKMLKGNQEFILVDDQKVVFENASAIASGASLSRKEVVIIHGGPGTGKSVVAINLLVKLSKAGLLCKYVSKNAAPRAVYKAKLTGSFRQTEISNLFSGSGSFIDTEKDSFDALVVDEAHRLNAQSGLYGNLGENQIKEVISSAKCTIFLVDDDQIVTLNDIGHSAELERTAKSSKARVTRLELNSQFRCNGSDNYLNWLDETLGTNKSVNLQFGSINFDFRVMDSPTAMHELIAERNKASNKARVVAGYCWDWVSKRNPKSYDILMPEFGYAKRWNLDKDGSLWIVAPDSIDEVGCIHTCQGLELDYIGVIVGPDLVARSGVLITHAESRSRMDRSIRGYKKLLKTDPIQTSRRLDQIIRNTYRTLMTRGLKGCYIYCVDQETQDFFKSKHGQQAQT